MAASPRWDALPAEVLYEIARRVPCKVDRARLMGVCRSWCAFFLEQLPPPQLPWLLHPSAGEPTFSYLLNGGGAEELSSVHRVRVPADLRAARYFGSYDGGWHFLAARRTYGNMLLNLRTTRRVRLPDIFLSPPPSKEAFGMIILAATLSSSPEADGCFGAAIVDQYWYDNSRHITFRCMGLPLAMPSTPPRDSCNRLYEMEDVIFHKGAFHFLAVWNLLVCTPSLHQGELRVHREWREFLRPNSALANHLLNAAARYLVESRGQLLMVVRSVTTNVPGLPPLAFRVFQMTRRRARVGIAVYTWTEVPSLGGRMLFVGRGCSRSYEVTDFPGFHFQEGIYFLDDQCFYQAHRITEFLCSDNGKWSGPPPVVSRCFSTDQNTSHYSCPVWLVP